MQFPCKYAVFITVLAFVCLAACGNEEKGKKQEKQAYEVDQTDPIKVVEAIFDIAGGEKAELLARLCDTLAPLHPDVRRICDHAAGFGPESAFALYFQGGEHSGPCIYFGDTAYVPIIYGPKNHLADTLVLLKRSGKWFLSRF